MARGKSVRGAESRVRAGYTKNAKRISEGMGDGVDEV